MNLTGDVFNRTVDPKMKPHPMRVTAPRPCDDTIDRMESDTEYFASEYKLSQRECVRAGAFMRTAGARARKTGTLREVTALAD